MNLDVHGNLAQMPGLMLNAKSEVSVAGRGTGKSFGIGFKMNQLIRAMPRSVTSITGMDFGQMLTRTLPSSFKLLNQMGYQQGVNYVIGRKPPSYFKDSYEVLNDFEHVISFSNGTRFVMISQSKSGSGRGANVDHEIIDEALTIDEEQYNNEVVPTNRGNNEFFGAKSPHPVAQHHGFSYFTSMPVTKDGRWIMKYGNYYLEERGIRIFDIWNRIVSLQIDMLDIARTCRQLRELGPSEHLTEATREFTRQWNEIARLQDQMKPFISRDGILFTISNAFDNLKMLGLSYILNAQDKMPNMIFLVEIMNMYITQVTDCFYNINEAKQVYYGSADNKRVLEFAAKNNYNLSNLTLDCSHDRDCEPSLPIEVGIDWGSSICAMVVDQERTWDFVSNSLSTRVCQTQINEFYTKPDTAKTTMIEDLIGQFIRYYAPHKNKTLYFYKDKYGDHKNPNQLNSKTFNEQAIDLLRKAGWNVVVKTHAKQEPAYSDRYNLWSSVLAETNPTMPLWRVNGDKCRYTLISMNNAKAKTVDNKLTKDKRSERPDSGVLPEEATHFSDARDKLLWSKYGSRLHQSSSTRSFSGLLGRR